MNEFRKQFNEVLSRVEVASKEFPWENKQCYVEWLAQTYYYVRHSTRLLALACGRYDYNNDNLHWRFAKHILEETRHEYLAVYDMQFLEHDITKYNEMTSTVNFYATQYYYIQNINPSVMFGYIMFLEGFAESHFNSIYKIIKSKYGEKAGVFLKVHAEEDAGHLEKAFKSIEPILHNFGEQITQNMRISCDNYIDILKRIKVKHENALVKAAA